MEMKTVEMKTVERKTVEKKTVEKKTVEMKTVENGEEAQTFIANLDLDLDLAQALKLPTAAASLPSTTPSKACSTIAASFHPTCPLQTQMHSSHDTNHPTESAPRMDY